jgi:acetoin:2,6-dichlorophenolindophenol oxidoreductase subunit beta
MSRELRNNEALREALFTEMERDERVVVLGEDVGRYGGLYQVTRGLQARFGCERVRDTPIAEFSIIGVAVGLAQVGLRPIAEIMFMDFMPLAMDQLVTQIGTVPYIWNQPLPLVIRVQGGSGGSSPHHAKTLEAWMCHIPDLVVVAPATPQDHKGLLSAAVRDDRPVLFVESRHIYGEKGPVADDDAVEPIGRAAVRREGSDVTVVTWGRMLTRCLAAAETASDDVSAEVIDLRTLVPLDLATIVGSIEKTGRCLIVHEAWQRMGYGAEVAARVAEAAFQLLDAPVTRHGAVSRPLPFSPVYADEALPTVGSIGRHLHAIVR